MKVIDKSKEFLKEVKLLANKYNLDFFIVTEGASIYSLTKNNEAIKNARNKHIEWEQENGFNPYEDWSKTS